MRSKHLLLSCIALSFVLLLNSCKKEETAEEAATTSTTGTTSTTSTTSSSTAAAAGTMQFTVGGKTVNSDAASTLAVFAGSGWSISGPQMSSNEQVAVYVKTAKAVSAPLTATLNGTDGTGTYQTGYGTSTPVSYLTNGTGGNVGTCTITKYDATAKKISGTFSFTGVESSASGTKTVTVGSFTDVKCIN